MQIRDLGISKVIDLTNSGETKALFTGTSSLSQCRVLNLPLVKQGFSVQQLADKYKRYLEDGEKVSLWDIRVLCGLICLGYCRGLPQAPH